MSRDKTNSIRRILRQVRRTRHGNETIAVRIGTMQAFPCPFRWCLVIPNLVGATFGKEYPFGDPSRERKQIDAAVGSWKVVATTHFHIGLFNNRHPQFECW